MNGQGTENGGTAADHARPAALSVRGSMIETIEQCMARIPGSFIQTPEGVSPAEAGALFSADGAHRYAIWRVWEMPANGHPRIVGWEKHNPSKASGVRTDATFTSACTRGQRWGFQGLMMGNLGAYVATDPKDYAKAADPIGPGNLAAMEVLLKVAAQVLAGWGNFGSGSIKHVMVRQAALFCSLAKKRDVPLWCLGTTSAGNPIHLLARGKHIIPADAQPERWRS